MRIIGGTWRHRRLRSVEGFNTRPILDRVKASVFDMLGARLAEPGRLPPCRVADIFAGSGSIGLEALSRGADSCVFFERDRKAQAMLAANIQMLGAGAVSETCSADIWHYDFGSHTPAAFDLLFVDPPYRDTQDTGPSSLMAGLLGRLSEERVSSATALLLLRHEVMYDFSSIDYGLWRATDCRKYGRMAVTIFEKARLTEAER